MGEHAMRIFCAALALCACAHAHAVAVCTWTGGGTDDKWSNADNWDGCQGIRDVPINTDALIFPDGAARKTNTNDIVNLQPASLQLNGLNYDISGNAITLTPSATSGISVNTPSGGFSDLGPRFRPAITLGGSQTFTCTASKFLYIDGALNLNGKQLGIDGACNTALRGTISGIGDIDKYGNGYLYLSQGPYTYNGFVTIHGGTVYVGTDTGLGATGSGPATFVESGAKLSLYLGITTGETIYLIGGTLENFLGDNTVSGDVTLADDSIVDVLSGTTLTLAGQIKSGSFTETLTKKGAGTLILGNTSPVAITLISAGTLEVDGTAGATLVQTGAALAGSGALTNTVSLLPGGKLAPGSAASPGTLTGTNLEWYGGADFKARLGSGSDRLVLSNNLSKLGGSGGYEFQFSDGHTPPKQGVEYTLVEYGGDFGFGGNDFSYTYQGTGPGSSLTGSFGVSDTKITFTVITVESELIFRDNFEP